MNARQHETYEQAIKAGRICPGMTFQQKVWALTARVPKGKVTTYAAIARKLGSQAYRAVGSAMHHNPYAPAVPCHRVVGCAGALTGFAGGMDKKRRMLVDEGIAFRNGKVDLERSGMTL